MNGLVYNHFKPILKRAGVPNIRLYDLRHTAATLALTVGVSPKVVSEQLGHTSAAFTLDVYSHVLPHMRDDAAAKVEAALMGLQKPLKVMAMFDCGTTFGKSPDRVLQSTARHVSRMYRKCGEEW